MGEAGPPDGGDGVGEVGDGFADPRLEVDGGSDELEGIDGEPVAEGDDN